MLWPVGQTSATSFVAPGVRWSRRVRAAALSLKSRATLCAAQQRRVSSLTSGRRALLLAVLSSSASSARAACTRLSMATDAHGVVNMEALRSQNHLEFDLSAEAIVERTEELIERNRQELDELAAKRPWGKAELLALEDSEMRFETACSSCTFPMSISTSAEVRDAAAKASNRISTYSVEASQREDVYQAVRELDSRMEELELNDEQKRWVGRLLRDFRRAGLELDAPQRERLGQIRTKISKLAIGFCKRLNEDMTKEAFSLEELAGMPDAYVQALEKAGENRYYVTLKYPDLLPLLQRCRVASTRKRMDFLKGAMCQEQNGPVFEQVLELRRELAALCGYDTFADFALEVRMAKTKEAVNEFLSSLQEKLVPYAKRELGKLLELKRAESSDNGWALDDKINGWDMMYYHTRLLDLEYNLDKQLVQEHFPLEVVLQGMMKIYQRILELRFERVDDRNMRWNDDVMHYAVYDEPSGELVGQFYLDMFPRDGKYGHAAVFGLQRAGEGSGGSVQLPCCAMLCNFTKPTAERPSLLEHREVVTLFHEFGHVMHNICTKTRIHSFSCTRVERDFVEAPSQMLENWCYEKEPLALMSRHYIKGSPLPEDLLNAIVRSKNVDTGLLNLRQIFFGTFDMAVHTSEGEVDVEKLWSELRESVSLIPQQPGCNPAAGFAHLMGGYESGYYGYLWSQVYSADLFTAFEGRLLDPQIGRRYRECILAPGGSQDGMQAVRNFLERDSDQEPFLRSIGVADAAKESVVSA